MVIPQNDRSEFLRTEYTALSTYFGTVITFRFTTASFFIAAVALVLRIEKLDWHHYLLLLLLSLGAWIVELRNRSLSDNLVRRAYEIEHGWANYQAGELPFFTHMILPPEDNGSTPKSSQYQDQTQEMLIPSFSPSLIPERKRRLDQTQILWFPKFRTRFIFITHTVGLDIVYLSVIAYSGWGLLPAVQIARQKALNMNAMDPVAAVLAVALALACVSLVKLTATKNGVKWPSFTVIVIVGAFLVLVAVAVVAFALCRAAYPDVGCICSWFVKKAS
jgi:hypothetical protein